MAEPQAGRCRFHAIQSFSLSIHSRMYEAQFSSFTPSASQDIKKHITSRSITPTSFISKTISRQSVRPSKSLRSSAVACVSIRPLRMNTLSVPRVAVSIRKVIDQRTSQSPLPRHAGLPALGPRSVPHGILFFGGPMTLSANRMPRCFSVKSEARRGFGLTES